MGLVANGFRDSGGLYLTSGATISNNAYPSALSANRCLAGSLRNKLDSVATTDNQAGVPMGYRNGGAWVMPQKAGALSMRVTASGDFAADLLPSYPMSIDMTGSGDLEATAGLVVSMLLAMTGSGSLTATIEGRLNMTCDLAGSGDMTAAMSGIASMALDLLGTGDLEATISALGNMEIDIVVTGTGLSTANVGASVWNALAASFNAAGTMGNKLNSAAAGGVDYEALGQAVWDILVAGTTTTGSMKELVLDNLDAKVSEVAAEVLAAAQTTPIHADAKKIKGQTITGTGTELDPWGPA